MAVHYINTTQKIPVSPEQAWDFFSNPANLQAITPGKMGLKIKSRLPVEKIYAGQLLEYTVRPLMGIPLYWMTEITVVEHGKYFIDEQRVGPYRLWHHQHHFNPVEDGVEMRDIVHYRIPLWILGDLANTLFLKKQVESIFDYRFKKVEELFGKWK